MTSRLQIDGPAGAPLFVFAHGAGAGMDSPFMQTMTALLVDRGIRVARFEFPYMAAKRDGRRSGAPDRQPVLEETWRDVIDEAGEELVAGGKSLGGRIATHVADHARVRGVVCFGYPFHPPSQPQKLRTRHLRDIAQQILIIQGTRDPFGSEHEIVSYSLSPTVRIEWMNDGDHSLKPRKRSGVTEAENLVRAADLAAAFIVERVRQRT